MFPLGTGSGIRERASVKKPQVFLTAEWKNLLMLNYAVDAALLQHWLPAGTELDFFKGRTYVSLVGFEFKSTRIRGFAIPFHRDFEEVNLRFYIKRPARRGVVFVRELVPRRAIAATARSLYGENYSCVPMSHAVHSDPVEDTVKAEYSFGSGASRCSMRVETEGPAFLPEENSLSQFITEHFWGYTARTGGGCFEYEVQHPRWLVRKAKHAEFSGDGARFYGPEFGKVLEQPADSAFLAEGSPVTVFKGCRVELT